MSKTKAELESEIAELRTRVARLEGEVAAYQYALNTINIEPQIYQPWTPTVTPTTIPAPMWAWPGPTVTNIS